MCHIETERNPLRKHLVDTCNHVICRTGLVIGSPFVEPSAPELTTHQRAVRTYFFQWSELLIDIRPRTEVHGPYKVIQSIQLEIRSPVTLEQGHIAEVLTHNVAYLGNILLAFAIRTVFILYLYHNNRTALLDSQSCHLVGHLFLEDSHTLQEIRVVFTQTDVFLLQEPPRQTAHLPFGAYIRSGTKDDIHIVLLAKAAELSQVLLSGKVELSRFLFMEVPEYVQANRIHAQRLALLDAVFPVSTGNARVMQFGSLYHKRLSVEQESPLPCLECSTLSFWRTRLEASHRPERKQKRYANG